MILNGSFLGASFYTNKQAMPIPIAYDKIKFYGSCILDDIYIKKLILTDEEILALNINDNFSWDNDTVLLAQFENNSINAGILTTINNPITKWSVNRKLVDGTVLKELGEIDKDITEFIDYTAQHNKSYIYDIFPITESEIGEALESDPITGDFYSWSLTETESQIVYLFDLNLKTNGVQNITDVSITNNYTQFPNISYGNTDYIQGGISCILGTVYINGQLVQPVDYIDDFRAFINNGKEKILKSRKGELYFVNTKMESFEPLDDNIFEQPYVLSFSFIQTKLSE